MTQTPTAVPGARRAAPGTVPGPAGVTTAGPAGPRLAWLDALRGLGALVVAYAHLGVHLQIGTGLVAGYIDLGRYGVLLFFLVSGYVIPMSLERHGSLRRFWVGRLFRIYPAWLLTVAAMAVLIHLGLASLVKPLAADPVPGVLGHAAMSQDLLGLPGLVPVFWTLTYEMVFYLLVSALFVLGLHGRSAAVAAGLAVAGLLGVRTLPAELFTATDTGRLVVAVLTVAVLAGSVCAYLSGRRGPALAAALVGLGCLALPALNGAAGARPHAVGSWQSLVYLAVMFSGTVLHAAHRGRLRPRTAAATLGTVFLASLLAGLWHSGLTRGDLRWVGTLVAVAGTFAAGYALRNLPVPRWATWLGQISYSVYLLHFVVLIVLVAKTPGLSRGGTVEHAFLAAGWFAVVLGAAHLAYTYVELPGQRLGRRVGRALDARLGRDDPGAPTAGVRIEQREPR
ncbi:acyltransferase family protein [Jidongwangia harbinensis]|uniref:acyltransferase family protein n=1 Tax=Jidongwangia harbinensis TaxID=2878561 RepID=UPI001CD957B7|nr:acyltransferase [Jidongwangia harbinensis]MCA2219457.1 acyltransferase [Jidongwangia harbinensis]